MPAPEYRLPDVSEADYQDHLKAFRDFARNVRAMRPNALAIMANGFDIHQDAFTHALSRAAGPLPAAVDRIPDPDFMEVVGAINEASNSAFFVGVALGLMLRPELFETGGAR
jgi:hypothetical protein